MSENSLFKSEISLFLIEIVFSQMFYKLFYIKKVFYI